MKSDETGLAQRGSALAAIAFYGLVALEFLYMASPFAAYFYGVYGPGPELLSQNSMFASITQFFLPHIVKETQSTLINLALPIGIGLFFAGLLCFAIAAFQVYKAKILKHQEVTGLLYTHIRHPQYLALMVWSFGMVLIWPRYLVLFAFILLAFIYVALEQIL